MKPTKRWHRWQYLENNEWVTLGETRDTTINEIRKFDEYTRNRHDDMFWRCVLLNDDNQPEKVIRVFTPPWAMKQAPDVRYSTL